MERHKERLLTINKAVVAVSGLAGAFFIGIACYFQVQAHLAGDSVIFYDLWITALWFLGFCIWHIPSKKAKKKELQ